MRWILVIALCATTPAWGKTVAQKGATATVKARVDAAKEAYKHARALVDSGRADPDTAYRWSVRWAASQALADGKPKGALADHLARMKEMEVIVTAQVSSGIASAGDGHAVAYYRAEAEDWVAAGKMR
jgi:hypothetical protein